MSSLKPQDVVVALRLGLSSGESLSQLSVALGISASEIHHAIRRGNAAGLLDQRKPNRRALLEFLTHGIRYAFYPKRGPMTRGLPTAHAAPPLVDLLAASGVPPVWPDPEGSVRGEALEPLYASVPTAAKNDPRLYELLALVDAVRAGRARERQIAADLLKERLS